MAKTVSQTRRKPPVPASNHDSGSETGATSDAIADALPKVVQGDRDSQRRLYELCRENVYRLMVRMVGLQDAPDLTQQVFLQVFRTIGQFSGRSRFETWLYRLAVNEALQHHRRAKRWRHQAIEQEPMDESSQGKQNAEHKELLEQALAQIEPELRSVFLLREVERLSYREIAEAVGIPEGTVGSRLNRARRELQQRLRKLGFEA